MQALPDSAAEGAPKIPTGLHLVLTPVTLTRTGLANVTHRARERTGGRDFDRGRIFPVFYGAFPARAVRIVQLA